ncbi:Na/Pi cotransporter family protein [Luteimonas deserti]|uniref:Na/Pi cotransporter family protein n=1 Tax=Luteimonas deserti TaxID=2752306 RepID=A0A7Z0QT31_9GAMM|nr:Na/Pi symporter [Luteimonas deserti]NYZ62943.1 Na/Pi cotransporter family protein [Luteimonas deserti]
MITVLSTVLGGIGLFLLGMVLMTDGLKTLAGDALRRVLARFTGNRLSAVAAGAGITALVQSSSATTLATIGFVSAGLLSFTGAIGVIIGANLGTTSTGWLVSLLGLKFSIAAAALPLVGVGALLRLVGRGRATHVGLVLAGFGLIFVGIDTLQQGMAGIAGRVDLAFAPGAGLWPRLWLVLVGAAMTVVMQSSSAAMATTLTALAGGAIGLDQAAALVIGQNIGTTVTAGLAAIGASVPARRTALVHALFNIGAGAMAFVILPWFVDLMEWVMAADGSGADQALAIAAFHTAFNLLGALVFVPLVPQLARLAQRILPDRHSPLTRHLDPGLREVPAMAVAAAGETLRGVLAVAIRTVRPILLAPGAPPTTRLQPLEAAVEAAARQIEHLNATDPATLARLAAAYHLLDHVRQFVREIANPGARGALDGLPALRAHALVLAADLDVDGARPAPASADGEFVPMPDSRGDSLRAQILEASAAREIGVDEALSALDVLRWMERLRHHACRAQHYLARLDNGVSLAAR